jgi:hypothetical protein
MATLGSKKTTTYHRVNHSNRTSNLNKSLIYTAPEGGRTLVLFDLITIDDFNSSVFWRKRNPINGTASANTDIEIIKFNATVGVSDYQLDLHILKNNLSLGVGRTVSTFPQRMTDTYYMIMHPQEELRLTLNRDNDSNSYHLSFVTITES